MILRVAKKPELEDDIVDVQYRELTPVISQILRICESDSSVILCDKDGTTHNVDLHDVLYIEWVDSKSFVYTENDVFTLALPLVKLEESLREKQFVRVSKMCLCNLYKIKSISNGLNMRLTAEMTNGERVTVNRHYRDDLLKAIHKLAGRILK